MRTRRIQQEAFLGGCRIVAVPSGDAGSSDKDFAGLARRNGMALIVENTDLHVRDGLTDGWRQI